MRIKDKHDPVVSHLRLDDFRGIRILPGKNVPGLFEEGHAAAESREGLSHLATDRSGADDGQARGEPGQGEDGFVCQVACCFQSVNGRGCRACAGTDRGFCEFERGAVHVDALLSGEPARAQEHVNAQAGKAMRRIHPAETCAQFSHSCHGGLEIGFDSIRNSHAEFPRPFYRAPRTGRANDTFRRHASHVQTIPAHQMAFDQGSFRAKPGSHHCGDQSGGAGSDDDDIVSTVGRGVSPGWRMDVVNELLIEFVHRSHGHGFISMIVGRHEVVLPYGAGVPDFLLSVSHRRIEIRASITMFSFPRIFDEEWERVPANPER